jgi:hypothetical protein
VSSELSKETISGTSPGGEKMPKLFKAIQPAAFLVGVMLAGAAFCAETLVPPPQMVGRPVQMRSWPSAGRWMTSLTRTTYDGTVCSTIAVDQKSGFGFRAKDDTSNSLSLIIGGSENDILAFQSIKISIDGFQLGEFPITTRIEGPTGKSVFALVPRSKASTLLELFGAGQWMAFSAGEKTYSVPLEGSDSALKAFAECTHEVANLSSIGATADFQQVERRTWIANCRRAGEIVGNLKLYANDTCLDIWERRATIPQFTAFSADVEAVISARARLPDSDDKTFQLASNRLLSTIETITAPQVPPSQPSSAGTPMATTLDRLRQAQRGADPGEKFANNDFTLSAAQRGEIGVHVRECWTRDDGAVNIDKLSVVLDVVTDRTGTARAVQVAEEDRGKMSDPVFQAFAKRAIRAVEDVRCATLPLPKDMMGRSGTLTFRFRP